MEKKYNFVYITTNLINGKQYIGDHSTNNLNDNYLGSGKLLIKAFKKYKKINFKREILEFFNTKKEAFNAQSFYINKYNTIINNGYNISPKGGLCIRGCHSEETIKLLKKPKSKKAKRNMSESHKGLQAGKNNSMYGKSVYNLWKEKYGYEIAERLNLERSKKLSNSLKGKHQKKLNKKQKEHVKEILLKKYGVDNMSKLPEVRNKISNSLKGNIPWNKNLKNSFTHIYNHKLKKNKTIHKKDLNIWLEKGWKKGVYVSKESLEKRRISQLGNKNHMSQKCWINKDNIDKVIKKEELEIYLKDKWNKGRANKGCWINKNNENKIINKNNLDKYLEEGWNKGRMLL
jgi:hypothetical protein